MNRIYSFVIKVHNFLGIHTEIINGENNVAPSPDTTSKAVKPIYDFLTAFGPALMGLLATVMALYAAILGFSYSKAENADDRDKAKKKLVNGVIGFGVILVLIVILYALRTPISNLIDG